MRTLVYSYSKLRTFENCPLQFRYRYLDRIETEIENIEGFNGRRVHEVLEALYRSLEQDPRPPELADLLRLYDSAWERSWHPHVEVVKESLAAADYHRMGGRCLATFYRGNWPFTGDRTLGLEQEIEFDLDGPESPRLRGIIDRVAAGERGELLIHDYKTSTYLPRQDEILADLQLAIYQLGSAERWPSTQETRLIWHFLSFGRRVTVRLGRSGLDEKREEIGRRIRHVEREVEAGNLPARPSALCRWCLYRRICEAPGARVRTGGMAGQSASLPPVLSIPPPRAAAPAALTLRPLAGRRPSAIAEERRAASRHQLKLL